MNKYSYRSQPSGHKCMSTCSILSNNSSEIAQSALQNSLFLLITERKDFVISSFSNSGISLQYSVNLSIQETRARKKNEACLIILLHCTAVAASFMAISAIACNVSECSDPVTPSSNSFSKECHLGFWMHPHVECPVGKSLMISSFPVAGYILQIFLSNSILLLQSRQH